MKILMHLNFSLECIVRNSVHLKMCFKYSRHHKSINDIKNVDLKT